MRHVAFLRGINVGKAKRVAMADLRTLLESMGYQDVATLLNSGNIVFTAPPKLKGDHAARIEKGIAAKLGVQSKVTVLTAQELAEVVKGNPHLKVGHDHSRLLVAFLAESADRAALKAIAAKAWEPGAFAVTRRAAYLWCPEGILDSPLAVQFGKVLKDQQTSRNWATVLKITALCK